LLVRAQRLLRHAGEEVPEPGLELVVEVVLPFFELSVE